VLGGCLVYDLVAVVGQSGGWRALLGCMRWGRRGLWRRGIGWGRWMEFCWADGFSEYDGVMQGGEGSKV